MIHLATDSSGRTILPIKAVPGASRSQIAGPLGDRLKVRISAPPEAGKANKAICKLLAGALDLRTADVEIISGHASAEKTVALTGCSPDDVARRLGL